MSSAGNNDVSGPLRGLLERRFRVVDGKLHVGALPMRALAEKYGTPFYVYDSDALQSAWGALRAAFPDAFRVHYSIKANPHRKFLQFFLARGCGLEVASAGEIHQAIQAGCDPVSIIYAGPGKTDSELELALTLGVGEIHVESLGEARRLSAISRRTGPRARIALRVNPSGEVQGGAMRMGGRSSPFGIDEEQLDAVLDQVVVDPQLEVVGVHLFTGTQILDADTLLAQYERGVEISLAVAGRLGKKLQTIDFGGGLGIPYFAHEQPLDLGALSRGLERVVRALGAEPLLREARLIVEPGRFLVGEAGLYVARVTEVKSSRGKQFVVVDGGMHHHLAASGNLGQTIKRNFPVALLEKLEAPRVDAVDVVGPLCTPLDVLARNVRLPPAEVGDLFGVFQSGAYARTASPLGFLSHPAPPEVWVDGARDALIRRRGEKEDLLRDQVDDTAGRRGSDA